MRGNNRVVSAPKQKTAIPCVSSNHMDWCLNSILGQKLIFWFRTTYSIEVHCVLPGQSVEGRIRGADYLASHPHNKKKGTHKNALSSPHFHQLTYTPKIIEKIAQHSPEVNYHDS